jgi:hypothetical protein
MEKFTLSRILSATENSKNKTKDIVEYHYKKLVYRINDQYKQYNDHCYYEVDHFVSKLPMYDSTKVAKDLVDYMNENGISCRVIYENRIFVWWKAKKRETKHLPEILKSCYAKIRQSADNGNDFLFFEVPMFLNGHPWYNSDEAAKRISNKLDRKGFIVKTTSNIIFISWNKDSLERKTRVKINFETNEEKLKKALEKINYINESRYHDFMNPKKQREHSDDDKYKRGLSNLKNDLHILNR